MPRALIGFLGKEREERGYYLVEPDDHLVGLYYKEGLIAVFPQSITIDQLHKEADLDWERRKA